MKKLLLGLVSAIALLMFTACASNSPKPEMKDVQYLNATQINEVFSGKTIEGVSNKGNRPFKLMFTKDGNVSGNVGNISISGTWKVDGNKKCMTIKNRTNCRKHFMKDGKYFTVTDSGDITSSFISK